MIPNLETEGLEFGSQEEFNRRLKEFYCYYLERIRSFPCDCWSLITLLFTCSLKNLFLKHYFAVTVLLLSAISFTVIFVDIRDQEHLIFAIYCVSFFTCSIVSLFFKKGAAVFLSFSEQPEQRQSLVESQESQDAAQLAGDDEKEDEKQLLHRAIKHLIKTKQENKTISGERRTLQIPYDFHHSDSYIPSNFSDYSSPGPSRASDPFPCMNCDGSAGPSHASGSLPALNCDSSDVPSHAPDTPPALNLTDQRFTKTSHTSDELSLCTSVAREISFSIPFEDTTNILKFTQFDSADFDKSPQHIPDAQISADAVNTFEAPAHVLGSNSYKVLHSSDQDCTFNEPAEPSGLSEVLKTGKEEKTFKTSVEVHHSDSHSPLSSSDDYFIYSELASIVIDKCAKIARSESYSNLIYLDDKQPSESASGIFLNVRNEQSEKTEDKF